MLRARHRNEYATQEGENNCLNQRHEHLQRVNENGQWHGNGTEPRAKDKDHRQQRQNDQMTGNHVGEQKKAEYQ